MRIVAGTFRGMRVDAPDGRSTRPTTDRVRESMFSALYSRLPDMGGVSVLDAFSGSGALGLEALSRGACRCTFYERDTRARRVLEGNVKRLGLSRGQARIVGGDVLEAARRRHLALPGAPYGLVLLDPPFALECDEVERFMCALAQGGCLAPGAVAVYEHDAACSAQIDGRFGVDAGLEHAGMKKYGTIGVAYLKYRPHGSLEGR